MCSSINAVIVRYQFVCLYQNQAMTLPWHFKARCLVLFDSRLSSTSAQVFCCTRGWSSMSEISTGTMRSAPSVWRCQCHNGLTNLQTSFTSLRLQSDLPSIRFQIQMSLHISAPWSMVHWPKATMFIRCTECCTLKNSPAPNSCPGTMIGVVFKTSK